MRSVGLFTFENLFPPEYDFRIYLDNDFARIAKKGHIDEQVQGILNRSAFEEILLPLNFKMQTPYIFLKDYRGDSRFLASRIRVDENCGLEADEILRGISFAGGRCLRYGAYNIKNEREALTSIMLFQHWRDFTKSILCDNRSEINGRRKGV